MSESKYPPRTAGSRAIIAFPKAKVGDTIRNVENMLTEKAKDFETIDYVYVVDENEVLLGVVSIKEIHSSTKDSNIEDLMTRKLVSVHLLTHQERIVYLALSHGIKAVPVVDKQNHLIGIVPHDIILKMFNEEVNEDIFRFGGLFHRVGKDYGTTKASTLTMIKTRTPWLIIGVFGGIVTASIISRFELVLSTLLTLAAFAPVLAYLSDAVGTQSETLVVRSLAIDPHLSLKSYFLREFSVACALAFICGGMLSGAALIGWQDPILGLIVGLSMFLSIVAAVLISTGFPFIFLKLHVDPAIASGPFATMISDVTTITIYFAVATELLIFFGLL
jgi:magnesium transporter